MTRSLGRVCWNHLTSTKYKCLYYTHLPNRTIGTEFGRERWNDSSGSFFVSSMLHYSTAGNLYTVVTSLDAKKCVKLQCIVIFKIHF